MCRRRHRRRIVARVAWAAWIAHADPLAVRSPDTPAYLGPARALIEAGRFSLSPLDPTPMFARTPGYPAFLAAILWVTGSEWAISPIQAAVSAATVAAVVLVGWRLVGLTAGLVAGALLVLDPLQLMASGTILTEGVASITVAAIAVAGLLVFGRRRARDVPIVAVFGLGAAVALATMVRPTMWFYPAVLLVLLGIRFRDVPRRAVMTRLLAFLIPVLLVVGGWQVRNHSTVDSWQLSGATGLLLYCSNGARIEARTTGATMLATRQRLGCPTTGDDPDGDCRRTEGWTCRVPDPDASGQGFDEWNRRGLEIMANHPVHAARITAEGVARQVAGPGTDTVRRYLGVPAFPGLGVGLFSWNALLWALAGVGGAAGLRSRHRAYWAFVIATIGYVIVVSTGDAAYARYRVPVIPLLALLAANGAQWSVRRLRNRRRQPASSPELGTREPAAVPNLSVEGQPVRNTTPTETALDELRVKARHPGSRWSVLPGGRAGRPGLTVQIPYCSVPTCGPIRSASDCMTQSGRCASPNRPRRSTPTTTPSRMRCPTRA